MLAPVTGVARYVRELALGLNGLGVKSHYFSRGAWSRQLPEWVAGASPPAWRRWLPSVPGVRRLDQLRQSWRFDQGVRALTPALYHEPSFLALPFDGPMVLTVHDASWVRHPEAHPAHRVRLMDRDFPRSLERADRVITVSEFTAQELRILFGVSADRLRPTPLAADPRFRPLPEADRLVWCQRQALDPSGFVLALGTLEPRKNLQTLVDAYEGLPAALARRHTLVIAGRVGWEHGPLSRRLEQLCDSGRARLLGHVPDEDLPALYGSAALLAYPSLYEGFGLPPLEAMACGTAVLVSNRASLPEVVGDAAVLVDALDADAIAGSIRLLLEDGAERARWAARGLARAQAFSWHRTAQQTLGVYRELVPTV